MKMRRIVLVMILVLISSNKVMAAHPTNMPKRFEVKSFLFGISNTDDLYLDVEVGDDGYFKMIIPELEWTSGIGKHKTTKLTVVGQAFLVFKVKTIKYHTTEIMLAGILHQ